MIYYLQLYYITLYLNTEVFEEILRYQTNRLLHFMKKIRETQIVLLPDEIHVKVPISI